MRITLLGTGTSSGVPMIGCKCEVCKSQDSHDRRLRSSALIEIEGLRVLIDCGPDFREQILTQSFEKIDAVLLTHEHYDHVGGLDDLRAFCTFGGVNIYGDCSCIDHIRERMPYCFGDNKYPSAPTLYLHKMTPGKILHLNSKVSVVPIEVMHGKMPILGFRIGTFAYITDMKTIKPEWEKQLEGVTCMVVNGLRHNTHPTHQSLSEAVAFVERLGVREAYLTHIAHSAGLHCESRSFLPSNISFGFDGQVINLP